MPANVKMVSSSGKTEARLKPITGKLTRDELLRRLKALCNHLQEYNQDGEMAGIGGYASAVAQPAVMKHKDKDVRLVAACCFADILRIYAPDPPYTQEQLKGIFNLFVEQLRGVKKVNTPQYERYFYLLESLAVVKSFIICTEIECDDVISDLFQTFFNIISDEHPHKVVMHMIDIMSTVIDEGDIVSQEVLDIIFSNILNPAKSENPAAYSLACKLIERTGKQIESSVTTFYKNVLLHGKTSESELADHALDLIPEIYAIFPGALLLTFPVLEQCLASEDKKERTKLLECLGSLFQSKESDLISSNHSMWKAFVGRTFDADFHIRQKAVSFISEIISSHNNVRQACELGISAILERAVDPDERVRVTAVESLLHIGVCDFSLIDERVIYALSDRTLDRRVGPRKAAIHTMFHLFAAFEKYGDKHNSSNRATIKPEVASVLVNKPLQFFLRGEVDTNVYIETTFSEILTSFSSKPAESQKFLVTVISALDERGLAAFRSIILRKRETRNILQTYLGSMEENVELKEKCSDRICRLVGGDSKLKEFLICLGKKNDDKLIKLLKKICLYDLPLKELSALKYELHELIDGKYPNMKNYLTFLVEHSVALFLSKESLMSLCHQAKLTHTTEATFDKLSEVIICLSKLFPKLFHPKDTIEEIITFLGSSDCKSTIMALKVLGNIGSFSTTGMKEKDKKALVKTIINFCSKGNAKEGKYAVFALAEMFPKDKKIVDGLCDTLVSELKYEENDLLLTKLSSLGAIALKFPDSFVVYRNDVISDFVRNELLLKARNEVKKEIKNERPWKVNASIEVQAKVLGIKLIVNFIKGANLQAQSCMQMIVHLLFSILLNDGNVTSQQKMSSPDRSRLRLAAVCNLMKLDSAVYSKIQSKTGLLQERQFQKLALTMQDPCFEVRHFFAAKVSKYLEKLRLPVRYMSVLALSAVDPEPENQIQSKAIMEKISQVMRKRLNYLAPDDKAYAQKASLLPEYSIIHLISLLAHHPDFSEDIEDLREFEKYIGFFLDGILHHAENYSFLNNLVETIKQYEDAISPSNSRPLYVLTDLTLMIINQKAQKSNWVLKPYPGMLIAPKSLFIIPSKPIRNQTNYLPDDYIKHKTKQTALIASSSSTATAAKKADTSTCSTSSSKDLDHNSSLNISNGSAKKKRKSPSVPERHQSKRAVKQKVGSYAENDDENSDSENNRTSSSSSNIPKEAFSSFTSKSAGSNSEPSTLMTSQESDESMTTSSSSVTSAKLEAPRRALRPRR
eukprot:Nk52_evm2s683 gene=Nk52_evmTU2s683